MFEGLNEHGLVTTTGKRIVYFFRCGPFIKIGYTSRNEAKRKREFETGNPFEIEIIGSVLVRDQNDERRLHRRFAFVNHRDEWFRETPEIIRAIAEIIEQHKPIDWLPIVETKVPINGIGDVYWVMDCPNRACVTAPRVSFDRDGNYEEGMGRTFFMVGYTVDAEFRETTVYGVCPQCRSRFRVRVKRDE